MKGRPKAVQESIMSDIHYLHSSYSENEFQVRLTEAITKWRFEEPGFAEYFLNQWNTEDSFNCWKIFLQCTWSGCYQQCSRIIQQNYQEEFYLRYTSFASSTI
jgi:hypothetical protein